MPAKAFVVCLAELEIATGSVWPPWRGRMNFLEHGQRQPGTPGYETLPDGWRRWSSWATLVPNPVWEEMVNTVTFEDPGILLLDYMHIATECVPEPSTLALLTMAAVGLLAYAWRRRRR